jgi:NAD(P)-dependent dehydrogenase (short-subunit alcohol dehydrogenase family)
MNVKELLSLKNKIILVTGGSRKYGRCIVEGLAEADGTVIVTSRDIELARETAADFQKQGLDVHPMMVDQADHDSVMALKKQILEEFGRLDVFINNAVSRPMTGYNAPISQFEESMKVNATGAMDLIREMTEVIAMSGGGSVINISSMFGMYGPDLSNYEGTNMGDLAPDYFFHNAGLINLNKFMAQMNAGKNIRFNSVSPGGIFSNQPQAFINNYCKKVPLRRMANNDDIKGIVVLLSSEAGSYINGENILMDGGLNA